MPTVALPDSDAFFGGSLFAGAGLVDSYGDAVRAFDQRLSAGIDAAAQRPESGPYLQFDPSTIESGIARMAASHSPEARLKQWVDERRMPEPASLSEDLAVAGKFLIGGSELMAGGAYNYGVRIAGAAGSIPYLLDSVDAAVGVQEGFTERYGYELQSQGAAEIGVALQPVGEFIQDEIVNPIRAQSEAYIGDAGTTFLFSGTQAAAEIGGLLLGSGSLRSLTIEGAASSRVGRSIFGDELSSASRVFSKADGIPDTGIPAFDALAIESSSFSQKIEAMRRAGYDVVANPEFTAARGEFDGMRFDFNPETMTRLDFAHEWRHFLQQQQMLDRGLRLSAANMRKAKPAAELGAYGYEQRLWERVGVTPSDEYLQFHTNQISEFEDQMFGYRSFVASPYNVKWRGIKW